MKPTEKKILLYILILISGALLILTSCGYKVEKPFVITSKLIDHDGTLNSCAYEYQDNKGTVHSFRETNNRYSIGDTIK